MFELVTGFYPSIHSLGQLRINDLSVLMKIVKAKKWAKEKLTEYNELKKKIAEMDALKDEKGNPIVKEGFYSYENEQIKIETLSKLKELDETKIEFKLEPINVESLKDVEGLNANTMEGLGEFLKM